MSERKFLIWWFIISLCLAGLVSPYASRLPGGLERIARDLGFIEAERTMFRSPAPGYSWERSLFGRLPASLAGMLGALIAFAVALFLAKALAVTKSKHAKRER